MVKSLFALFFLVGISSCSGQEKRVISKADTNKDSISKPQVTYRVNKKFDDKGNMISYDSSYVWSYSSDGIRHNTESDSIIKVFRKHFDSSFPSAFSNSFGVPVRNDSFFYRDFASPDYFMQKWKQHYLNMENMMRRIDTLRNSFIADQDPYLSIMHED